MLAAELLSAFDQLEKEGSDTFLGAISEADLEAARVAYIGAKNGQLRSLQKQIPEVEKELKPEVGKRFNEVRESLKTSFDTAKKKLSQPVSTSSFFDVTLPGQRLRVGHRHPLTRTIEEVTDIMGRLGFARVEGPEVEDEWHNFDALNIPMEHPARDPLDNFFMQVSELTSRSNSKVPLMLRSQTSTVQIRTMEQSDPPIRMIAVGRCYRPDTVDATHSFMFHQMEGLMVDTDVTMSKLKTVLRLFATAYLGHDVRIRFRPSFFPFTEPSVEVDMSWGKDGKQWMELGGAGMVDPHVLKSVGYDPDQYSGFAFGLGIERLAMRRYGIDDIRLFYANDQRFLCQF